MQFYDIYNPEIGIGLAVITHNLNHNPIDYSLQKNSSGVSAFIQYPKEFYTIAAGQTIQFPEVAILCHKGDWQEAIEAYKNWVKTWYNLKRPESREWFNKISLLKDYFLSEKVCWKDLHIPPMYSRKTKEFQIDEYLKKDKEYWAVLSPDAIHFFHWFRRDDVKEGGEDYGRFSYDNFGLEKFKAAIGKLQKNYNNTYILIYASRSVQYGHRDRQTYW